MLKTYFNWSYERFISLLPAMLVDINIAEDVLGEESFFVCLGALEP